MTTPCLKSVRAAFLGAIARDHAARVVQDAYLHGAEQGSWGRARRRRAWESSRVEREIILSDFPDDGTIDLFWFEEGLTEAAVRIQAVWRGACVRAAAVGEALEELSQTLEELECQSPRQGFDVRAAGALFAARWAAATAATAQGSAAVIYNAAPVEGDESKEAVLQARGDEKESDADTVPQLKGARSEAGGDSDADAACLPKPTQSSPHHQLTSGRGSGQPPPLVARFCTA